MLLGGEPLVLYAPSPPPLRSFADQLLVPCVGDELVWGLVVGSVGELSVKVR